MFSHLGEQTRSAFRGSGETEPSALLCDGPSYARCPFAAITFPVLASEGELVQFGIDFETSRRE